MKKLNKIKVITVLAAVPMLSIFLYPAVSFAAPVIHQGTTTSYAILAGSTITNSGTTSVTGTAGVDVGVSPGSAITNTGTLGGTQHINDASAIAAQTSLTTALSDTNAPVATVIPADLNAQVLHAGSYKTGSSFLNSGTLTFDAQGDANAIFVMQSPSSTIATSVSSTMVLTNGAQACNVFWAIGSSATLGASSTFVGHLYAATSISLGTGATVHGDLLAQSGAVTLLGNTIVNDNCAASVVSTPTPVQTSKITSVTPANCVVTGTTAITINGIFPTLVTNITVNGKTLALGSWTQTPTTVVVNAVTSSTVPTVIQLYNGQAPVLVVQNFTCAPGAVVTPIPPVVIIPPGTGTIHVIKIVDNAWGGTATPGDFTLSLRHHGTDVLGSPDVGVASPGRTYILAPGTYVLGEEPSTTFPNYIESFDIVGQASNVINLKSGDDITITQTNLQLPPLAVATTPPTVVTVTGGTLPKTATPWFNLLGLGFLAMVGSLVVLTFKRNTKAKS